MPSILQTTLREHRRYGFVWFLADSWSLLYLFLWKKAIFNTSAGPIKFCVVTYHCFAIVGCLLSNFVLFSFANPLKLYWDHSKLICNVIGQVRAGQLAARLIEGIELLGFFLTFLCKFGVAWDELSIFFIFIYGVLPVVFTMTSVSWISLVVARTSRFLTWSRRKWKKRLRVLGFFLDHFDLNMLVSRCWGFVLSLKLTQSYLQAFQQ